MLNAILDLAAWRSCATKFENEQELEQAMGLASKNNANIEMTGGPVQI